MSARVFLGLFSNLSYWSTQPRVKFHNVKEKKQLIAIVRYFPCQESME